MSVSKSECEVCEGQYDILGESISFRKFAVRRVDFSLDMRSDRSKDKSVKRMC